MKITKRKVVICVIVIIFAAVLLTIFVYAAKSKSADETGSAAFDGYSGYIIKTDRDPFFVSDNQSAMLSENELVRMQFENIDFPAEDFSTGDKIKIYFQRVGDLNPRVAFVDGIERIEAGNVDNIDTEVLNELENLGYDII